MAVFFEVWGGNIYQFLCITGIGSDCWNANLFPLCQRLQMLLGTGV